MSGREMDQIMTKNINQNNGNNSIPACKKKHWTSADGQEMVNISIPTELKFRYNSKNEQLTIDCKGKSFTRKKKKN